MVEGIPTQWRQNSFTGCVVTTATATPVPKLFLGLYLPLPYHMLYNSVSLNDRWSLTISMITITMAKIVMREQFLTLALPPHQAK